ncbi:hypothetical protein [Pedobacter sp. SL55]|uniref:hypothetical protein n=1 Tax=Pedobacter sp. SL55 TaxID=2995161 RepID=UPI0022718AEA|nr:hypothetical protein [Pedobacter sp. SL55]WAC41497.1 hypothetical protein OVA16_03795 [Pedobacter sp. SL55]
MKNNLLNKVDTSLKILSSDEMQNINGGAEQPKSIFYWAGYYVGKFVGLASYAGVGLAGSN